MGSFYTDVIGKDARFHSTERISDMGLLEPFTRQAVMAIQLQAKAKGITLIVLETYRSQARQESLYEQKKTRLRSVGVHHYGLACDLARMKDGTLVTRGSIDWTEADYEFLAPLAKTNGMVSGLDWGHPERGAHLHRRRSSPAVRGERSARIVRRHLLSKRDIRSIPLTPCRRGSAMTKGIVPFTSATGQRWLDTDNGMGLGSVCSIIFRRNDVAQRYESLSLFPNEIELLTDARSRARFPNVADVELLEA